MRQDETWVIANPIYTGLDMMLCLMNLNTLYIDMIWSRQYAMLSHLDLHAYGGVVYLDDKYERTHKAEPTSIIGKMGVTN